MNFFHEHSVREYGKFVCFTFTDITCNGLNLLCAVSVVKQPGSKYYSKLKLTKIWAETIFQIFDVT